MRFDPTLGSNNLGLKKCRIRNHHIFGIARTSAFIWHIWIPLKKFCKRTRRVCVWVGLVHFGRYSQEVNEKSVKLAVWAVSSNFLHDFTLFVVDIHQIRLISLFRHFSDHFHFHPILEQKRVIDLIPCRMNVYCILCILKHKWLSIVWIGGVNALLADCPAIRNIQINQCLACSYFNQNHISYISRQNTVCHLLAKTMLHVNMPRLPHILVTAWKDGGFQLWQHLEKKVSIPHGIG